MKTPLHQTNQQQPKDVNSKLHLPGKPVAFGQFQWLL